MWPRVESESRLLRSGPGAPTSMCEAHSWSGHTGTNPYASGFFIRHQHVSRCIDPLDQVVLLYTPPSSIAYSMLISLIFLPRSSRLIRYPSSIYELDLLPLAASVASKGGSQTPCTPKNDSWWQRWKAPTNSYDNTCPNVGFWAVQNLGSQPNF